jgi:hypothetical protein
VTFKDAVGDVDDCVAPPSHTYQGLLGARPTSEKETTYVKGAAKMMATLLFAPLIVVVPELGVGAYRPVWPTEKL